jgi:hypothetical protein
MQILIQQVDFAFLTGFQMLQLLLVPDPQVEKLSLTGRFVSVFLKSVFI